MKRKLMLLFVLCMCLLVGCGGNDDEKDKGKNTETQQESEIDTEAEKVANMTEEEYKEYCKEIFREELFERRDLVGAHVKIYGAIHGKGSYSYRDMFASAIRDLTRKYDLSEQYFSVAVARDNKDDVTFVYSGSDYMYLLFKSDEQTLLDEFKAADMVTIYGEVVQCAHGPFIIPKYIEYTEIEYEMPDMDSSQE